MRIISGSSRGMNLETIEGLSTRPTTDRVKEALFNLIQFHIKDSMVLDLYAGSGSIGIECASRGAQQVYAVENNDQCIDVINQNFKKARLDECATVIKGEVMNTLRRLGTKEKFDVIFMDPPYGKEYEESVVELIRKADILAPEGIIVIEHSVDTEIGDNYVDYKLIKQKKYGKTMISVLEEA